MELLTSPYTWMALCVILLIIEVLAFSGYLLGYSAAAIAVSLLGFVFPEMGVTSSLLIFSILGTIATYFSVRYFSKRQDTVGNSYNDNPLIGALVVVEKFDELGAGRQEIKGTSWAVQLSEEHMREFSSKKNVKCKVVSISGTVANIEPIAE